MADNIVITNSVLGTGIVQASAQAIGAKLAARDNGDGTWSLKASGLYDPDAAAFFARAGITDATEKNAWNDFVVGAKSDDFWNDVPVFYPFIGGSATAHSKNAKSDAFNITWFGTIDHTAYGITGDGVSGYGDTGFNPSSNVAANSGLIAAYIRSSSYAISGVYESSSSAFSVWHPYADNHVYLHLNDLSVRIDYTPFAIGFLAGSRTSDSLLKLFLNGSELASNTDTQTATQPNFNFYILTENVSGSPSIFGNSSIGFFCFGPGLSDAKIALLSTRVATLMTALGRAV